MKCGRCKKRIKGGPQYCWFCPDPLCYDCWNEHGHCGHAEADAINAECRRRDAVGLPKVR